jgi:hypothetical protein
MTDYYIEIQKPFTGAIEYFPVTAHKRETAQKLADQAAQRVAGVVIEMRVFKEHAAFPQFGGTLNKSQAGTKPQY